MEKIVDWRCPICGWKISDIEYQSARFDYPCVRCQNHLSDFVPTLKKENIFLRERNTTENISHTLKKEATNQ